MHAYRKGEALYKPAGFSATQLVENGSTEQHFLSQTQTNLSVIWLRKAGTAFMDVSFQTKHTAAKRRL